MIKAKEIEAIQDFDFPFIFDTTIKVQRRNDVFDISFFEYVEHHVFTGGAEACAKFLNDYFERQAIKEIADDIRRIYF